MNKRFKIFLKQMQYELLEPSDEEMKSIQGEVKRYILLGVIPETKFARQLAYKMMKGADDMIAKRLLPSMPHEQWMQENKTMCQPLDWEPDPNWKPKPGWTKPEQPEPDWKPKPEPEPVKEKPKLHIVKKVNDVK
ncbi:MAG: hypothetical protein AB1424_08945 [Thermodesulfobacteriota bacterium]